MVAFSLVLPGFVGLLLCHSLLRLETPANGDSSVCPQLDAGIGIHAVFSWHVFSTVGTVDTLENITSVLTGFGAQLFKEHQLITSGPYALVRHPMYAGLILAALGSLLIYFTWTTLYFACFAPFMLVRARREEVALAAEFGEKWQDYCKVVPAFIPQIKKQR